MGGVGTVRSVRARCSDGSKFASIVGCGCDLLQKKGAGLPPFRVLSLDAVCTL